MTNSGSLVWNFFTKVGADGSGKTVGKVLCNLCGKSYRSNGNTTNFATHLKNKHFHAYMQLVKKSKDNVEKQTNKSTQLHAFTPNSKPSSSNLEQTEQRNISNDVSIEQNSLNIEFHLNLSSQQEKIFNNSQSDQCYI